MLVRAGNWIVQKFKGPDIEKPKPVGLDKAIDEGFAIGAIVIRPHTKMEDWHKPESWAVISEYDDTPRWNTNRGEHEFFKLKPVAGYVSYGSGYCKSELILVQKAPTSEIITNLVRQRAN